MTRMRHHRSRALGVVASTMMMMMVIAWNPLLIQALSSMMLPQSQQQRSYSRVKQQQQQQQLTWMTTMTRTTRAKTAFSTSSPTALMLSSSSTDSQEKPKSKVQWNLNQPGTSPFGFDRTAEVWNGRIAQIAFVWVLLQEWIQGKGLLQGIAEQDVASTVALYAFLLLLGAVSIPFWLEPIATNGAAAAAASLEDGERRDTKRSVVNRSSWQAAVEEEQQQPEQPSRKWNFNERGTSPFGFDKNAEIWNGRVAQVSFVWVMLQEWIQGKGLLAGIRDGDAGSVLALGVFIVNLGALVYFLDSASRQQADEEIAAEEAVTQAKAAALTATPASTNQPVSSSSSYSFASYEASLRSMTQEKPPSPQPSSLSSSPSPLKTGVAARVDPLEAYTRSLQAMTAEEPSRSSGSTSRMSNNNNPNTRGVVTTGAPSFQTTSAFSTSRSSATMTSSSPPPLPLNPAYDTTRWSLDLAELWNGRFAQISFVVAFGMELIRGKGALKGIAEGDPVFMVGLISVIAAAVATGGTALKNQSATAPEATTTPAVTAATTTPPATVSTPPAIALTPPIPPAPTGRTTPTTGFTDRFKFKSSALAELARGGEATLKGTTAPPPAPVLVTAETQPGVRPYPKPDSFSFRKTYTPVVARPPAQVTSPLTATGVQPYPRPDKFTFKPHVQEMSTQYATRHRQADEHSSSSSTSSSSTAPEPSQQQSSNWNSAAVGNVRRGSYLDGLESASAVTPQPPPQQYYPTTPGRSYLDALSRR